MVWRCTKHGHFFYTIYDNGQCDKCPIENCKSDVYVFAEESHGYDKILPLDPNYFNYEKS